MRTTAIIVAAGRGTRAQRADAPHVAKQWQIIAGARVIDHTLRTYMGHPDVGSIVLVLHPDDMGLIGPSDDIVLVRGGSDRAESVRNGLAAVGEDTRYVLIHDVARPCVSQKLISNVISALSNSAGAAPALAVTDALWTGAAGLVTGTQDRTNLYRAQTPQGFDFTAIVKAHAAHPGGAADDVEVARAFGLQVAIVDGEEDNLKITQPADFDRAARILMTRQKAQKDGY